MSSASDEELLAPQCALQEEARQVLAELDLAALVADIGPLFFAGSFVSGLMCCRELDVMEFVGEDFSPQDVLWLHHGAQWQPRRYQAELAWEITEDLVCPVPV